MHKMIKWMVYLLLNLYTLGATQSQLSEESIPIKNKSDSYPKLISKLEYKRNNTVVARICKAEYSSGVQLIVEFCVADNCWIEWNLDSNFLTGKTSGDVFVSQTKDSITVVSSAKGYCEIFFIKERKFADGLTRINFIDAGRDMEKKVKRTSENEEP